MAVCFGGIFSGWRVRGDHSSADSLRQMVHARPVDFRGGLSGDYRGRGEQRRSQRRLPGRAEAVSVVTIPGEQRRFQRRLPGVGMQVEAATGGQRRRGVNGGHQWSKGGDRGDYRGGAVAVVRLAIVGTGEVIRVATILTGVAVRMATGGAEGVSELSAFYRSGRDSSGRI